MTKKKWLTPVLALSIGLAIAPPSGAQEDVDTDTQPSITQQVDADTPVDSDTDIQGTDENTVAPQDGVEQESAENTQTRSTTPEPAGSTQESKVTLKATAKQTQDGDKAEVEVKLDYRGLDKGEEYTAVSTITDKDGKKVVNKDKHKFTAEGSRDNEKFAIELKDAIEDGKLDIVLQDADGNKVSDVTDVRIGGKHVSQSLNRLDDVQIKTNASMDADVIQTGAVVSDTIRYEGLTPGVEYRVETRLMCHESAEDTKAFKETNFVADNANGEVTIEDVEIADPDCMKQVVFEKVFEADSGKLVATHEDIDDAAQTIGDGTLSKKKKKKKNPTTQITRAVPKAPTLSPGGNPGRDTIGSVPSGEISSAGKTLFAR